MKLSKKQANVLYFICQFLETNKFSPTYKDIAAHFNFSSVATVRTYLEYLEEKGYIQRHGKARALTIKHNPFDTPIIGQIQAGTPIEAIENIECNLHDLPVLQKKTQRFGLKVKGDSMINAGIMEQDIAIIDTKETIISGNIVAAKIKEEVTLKRYKKIKSNHLLIAENPNYSPITLAENDKLIGKCIGVIRNLN